MNNQPDLEAENEYLNGSEKETRVDDLADDSSLADLLKGISLNPETKATFDSNVLRRHRISTARKSFNYWSPALIGGTIAGLAAVSLLQMLTATPQKPTLNLLRESTAKRDLGAKPSFHLPDSGTINSNR